jgi:SPP1 family predicted phage head-tail adaptor
MIFENDTKYTSFGNLDRRVGCRRLTEAQSNTGFPVQTWATAFTTFAKVYESEGGNEAEDAMRMQQQHNIKAIVRYNSQTSGMTAKDRLLYDGLEYDIENIAEVYGRKRFLAIKASRKV